jgi:hypothetical protein
MVAKKKAKSAPKPRGYNFAGMGLKKIVVPIITAVGQAAVKAYSFTPGFAFRIVSVESYCLNKAGVVTGDVKIGAVSAVAAAVAFAAAAITPAPLVGGAAKFRGGKKTDVVNVHYTSDGAGVLTNGFITVTIEAT